MLVLTRMAEELQKWVVKVHLLEVEPVGLRGMRIWKELSGG